MNTNTENIIQELESQVEVGDNISDIRWFDAPVLIIFFVLFAIVALQFITRYVLNDSLSWTEEIARYILMMLCFVGSINCVRKGSHIFLEFFYRYLSAKIVKLVVIFVEILVAGFFGFIYWLCLELGSESAQSMVSINAPKSIVYYIIAIACFVSALFAVLNIVRYIKSCAEDIYCEKLNIKG